MEKNFYKISTLLIIFSLILSFYSSLNNGLSIDENFHHINGEVRYHYLVNLGNFEKYDFIYFSLLTSSQNPIGIEGIADLQTSSPFC